jgi:hypothetical protein
MTAGFTAFWAAWPANTQTYSRKGAKGECLKKWHAMSLEIDALHIVAHVQWLKTTGDWQKSGGEYIPAPLVYLNQQRWDGAEIPPSPAQLEAEREAVYQRQLASSIAQANPAGQARVAEQVAQVKRILTRVA